MKSTEAGYSKVEFVAGQRGCTLLKKDMYFYVRNRRSGFKTYWICSKKVHLFLLFINFLRSQINQTRISLNRPFNFTLSQFILNFFVLNIISNNFVFMEFYSTIL